MGGERPIGIDETASMRALGGTWLLRDTRTSFRAMRRAGGDTNTELQGARGGCGGCRGHCDASRRVAGTTRLWLPSPCLPSRQHPSQASFDSSAHNHAQPPSTYDARFPRQPQRLRQQHTLAALGPL